MEETADPEALTQMRRIARPGTKWAAYQNKALDSASAGHVQFLLVGEGCAYAEPPKQYPADTANGMGWRYLFIGYVSLDTGAVAS